ncbi:MAG: YidC/Oxa1 family membrane protein insertase [Verrucomicrobiales bacterium]|jgi:YidC/Oxa1 family membrane protein insertase
MDRTGCFVIALVGGLLAYYYLSYLPAQRAEDLKNQPVDAPAVVTEDPAPEDPATPPPIEIEPVVTHLANEEVDYEFTNLGGGVKIAEQLDHALTFEGEERVKMNAGGLRYPVGAIAPNTGMFEKLPYRIESQTEDEIVYVSAAADRTDGLEVRKHFRLKPFDGGAEDDQANDEHVMHMMLTLTNKSEQNVNIGSYQVYGGAVIPQNRRQLYYSSWFYWDDGDLGYENLNWFNQSKFLGITFRKGREQKTWETEELQWGGVSNQFFTSIIRPTERLNGEFWVQRFPAVYPEEPEETEDGQFGVECAVGLPNHVLVPNTTQSYSFEIYLGPREYARLAALPDKQKKSMAYGEIPLLGWLFGWATRPISQILVYLMVMFHGWFGDFGGAVILLTVVVRVVMWPLHAKAHRTSKRMAQLAPKIKELKEKHADDPQRQQQEQMKLWGTYGINPMGGCLPALVQMPIFLGYFRMLSSASELRHEGVSFLWLKDLSAPDTVGQYWDWLPLIGGWDLNLLPFLMAGTSYLQFMMMPKTGDKNQRIIFMLMPLMFFFFAYGYASALALYWTCQNIISIGQTWLLNRQAIPELVKRKVSKKGFMQRLQDQAEAAKKQKEARSRGGSAAAAAGPGGAKPSYDRGDRTTKPKPKPKRKGTGGSRKGGGGRKKN